MWEAKVEVLDHGRVHRVALLGDGAAVSYFETAEHWRTDEAFRAFFAKQLADAPFDAYFWETPPVTRTTAARAFEFVLVNSPPLATLALEPDAFAGHFERSEAVATFSNIGGDALLVAPAPQASPKAYAHVAAFARQAPIEQQDALWQAVGAAVAERFSPKHFGSARRGWVSPGRTSAWMSGLSIHLRALPLRAGLSVQARFS